MCDGFLARFSKELIYVNAEEDGKLREFLAFCRGLLNSCQNEMQRVESISAGVSNALGGCPLERSVGAGLTLSQSVHALVEESEKEKHENMLLGDFFCGGEEIFGKGSQPGAGICRHRSILFKYTCDALDICPCALIDGVMPDKLKLLPQARERDEVNLRDDVGNFDHMWNVVHVQKKNFLVDALNFPGTLMSEDEVPDLPVCFLRVNGGAGTSLFKPCDRGATAPSDVESEVSFIVGASDAGGAGGADARAQARRTSVLTGAILGGSGDGGVMKQTTKEGSGACPQAGDTIFAHYTGKLPNGIAFDDSMWSCCDLFGAYFKLGDGEIGSWHNGFATMKKGEEAVLTCNSNYAYAWQGLPPSVPANVTLVYEVRLLDFKKCSPVDIARMDQQVEAARLRREDSDLALRIRLSAGY